MRVKIIEDYWRQGSRSKEATRGQKERRRSNIFFLLGSWGVWLFVCLVVCLFGCFLGGVFKCFISLFVFSESTFMLKVVSLGGMTRDRDFSGCSGRGFRSLNN